MRFVKSILFSFIITFLVSSFLLSALPDAKAHIYFLDIGQGDSVLIQSKNNRFILIDGGPNLKASKLAGEIIGNLRKKIDLVILTHPHNDHYAGLIEIIKKYEINAILLPKIFPKDSLYTSFLDEISRKNIKTIFPSENIDIDFGDGIYIDIISAGGGENLKNINESSIIFRLIYGKNKIIFTGDSPIEEEISIMQSNKDLSADILKVAHHGSKYSTSEEFLYETAPSYAVIQSGIKNKFGHPHKEMLDRLIKKNVKIFRNDLEGTIEITLNGSTLSSQAERREQ